MLCEMPVQFPFKSKKKGKSTVEYRRIRMGLENFWSSGDALKARKAACVKQSGAGGFPPKPGLCGIRGSVGVIQALQLGVGLPFLQQWPLVWTPRRIKRPPKRVVEVPPVVELNMNQNK